VKEQLHMMADTIASSAQTSLQPSYADEARSPPTSQPRNVRTLSSMRTTPSHSRILYSVPSTRRESFKRTEARRKSEKCVKQSKRRYEQGTAEKAGGAQPW
jgi:hypothetical protein